MRLIDVTNSYPHLVQEQLAHTDTSYVKVYSLGATTVIYTRASTHDEMLFTNETRRIKKVEIDFALEYLAGVKAQDVDIVFGDKYAEVSLDSHSRNQANEG